MNDFSIITRLTSKEYKKVMFVGLYKKPSFILATLLGLYVVITIMLDRLNVINWYAGLPIFEIVLGAFLLFAPTFIVLISVRQFNSNPSFQNDITYTFSESGVACKSLTFESNFLWTHIIKQKEIGKFLILYHSEKFGNFVDKTNMTTEQLNFIKSKIRQK